MRRPVEGVICVVPAEDSPPWDPGSTPEPISLPSAEDVQALRTSLDTIRQLLDGLESRGAGPPSVRRTEPAGVADADRAEEGAFWTAASERPEPRPDGASPVGPPPVGASPVGPPPVGPPPLGPARSRRRSVALVACAVGIVALLSVGVRAVIVAKSDSPAPASSGGVAGSADGAGSAGGRPSSAEPGPSTAPRPDIPSATSALPWPGSASGVPPELTGSGPGVDAPGTDIVIAPTGDPAGSLDVYERVLPTPEDATEFTLTGFDPARHPEIVTGGALSVTDLTASSSGGPALLRPVPDGWVVARADGTRLGPVVLRYRVSGAVVATPAAKPGRSLVVVWPLSGEYSSRTAGAVILHPDRTRMTVTQILCPLAAPSRQLCGSVGPQGWTGRIPVGATDPLMLVQADPPSR